MRSLRRSVVLAAALSLVFSFAAGGCGKKPSPAAKVAANAGNSGKKATKAGAAEEAAAKEGAPAAEPDNTAGEKAQKPAAAAVAEEVAGVPREAFNKLAAELYAPVFWHEDSDKDGKLDAKELAVLWGFGAQGTNERGYWEGGGRFTDAFKALHKDIVARHSGKGPKPIGGPDAKRQAAVLKELRQGRPTLILTTFEKAHDYDRKLVALIVDAARTIEQIYAKQRGVDGMTAAMPPEDLASRMLLYRNQGPWCVAPRTEKDPDCHAMNGKPARISGLYPKDLQADPDFCDKLAARDDARALMHHFAVVSGTSAALKAVPYHEAFAGEMRAVADKLDEASKLLQPVPSEAAFRTYLMATAKAFRDGSWTDADEAWSRMNARNSRWFLRIGPDETYFEPCSRKAGFHVSFARINQDSLRWQDKLDPLKSAMETAIATLAGAPYQARKVAFHLPDFIDMILNAADSRSAHGATVGQSLPNWGPVANEGRGRTVAMTNLYTDADSTASFKEQAASLICAESLGAITWDQEPSVMSTVLHEAAHNLGPAHEYKVNGKVDDELFGGPLASTMEELKAQTAALYLNGWLAKKGTIDSKLSHSAWGRDVLWSFGHISRGMYNSRGKPKPYSQLASIQIGYLLQEKAATWNADKLAANGKDKGCLALDYGRFGAATEKLMKVVAEIKAKGDKAGALTLRQDYVDADGAWKELRKVITERWLRSPKATFVYSIDL